MKILGVSGTVVGSKTAIVIGKILDTMKIHNPELEIEFLDLRDYQIEFCDGRPISNYTGDTKKVIDQMMGADGYVFGTPIFQGSFSGAFKNLIDLIPPTAFKHKVMGFVTTGGNNQHFLVAENQLKPLAGYLNGYVVPKTIFAHNSQFNDKNEVADLQLLETINDFSKQYCYMSERLMGVQIKN
ncbi:NADPH-dependent FMN reductase [Neobacillus citreus]|uniref:NAD(P)H-dependent oxidoreductase n=1 Tax=Neobacillus citreus TaxID=2833578 RepID=A0A942T635_9BACI|nr:NAD(P)H-dependent oxidoreductase [Neobacillus citreus]MCH6266439.1 NAD(P)H-dependent oxidoreductase [Neobacillus citreus]